MSTHTRRNDSQCADIRFVSIQSCFALNSALGSTQHRLVHARNQNHLLENTTECRRRLVGLFDRMPLFNSVDEFPSRE
jgi:hypothetical protein